MNSNIVDDDKILEIFSDEFKNNKKGLLKINNKNRTDFLALIISKIIELNDAVNNKNKKQNQNNDSSSKLLITEDEENEITQKKLKSLRKHIKDLDIENDKNHTILNINKQPSKFKEQNNPLKINNINSTNINVNNINVTGNDPSEQQESKISINSFYADFLKKMVEERQNVTLENSRRKKEINTGSSKSSKKINKRPEKTDKSIIINEEILVNALKQCFNIKNENNDKIEKNSEKESENENITKTNKKSCPRKDSQYKFSKSQKKIPKKFKKDENYFQEENKNELNNDIKENFEEKLFKERINNRKKIKKMSYSLEFKDFESAKMKFAENSKKRKSKQNILKSAVFKDYSKIFPHKDYISGKKENIIIEEMENNLTNNNYNTDSKKNKMNISSNENSNDFIDIPHHYFSSNKKQKNKNIYKNNETVQNSFLYNNISFESENDNNNSPRQKIQNNNTIKCLSTIKKKDNSYDTDNYEYNSNDDKKSKKSSEKNNFYINDNFNSKNEIKNESHSVNKNKIRKQCCSLNYSSFKDPHNLVKYKIRQTSNFNKAQLNKKQNIDKANENSFAIMSMKSKKMCDMELIQPGNLITIEYNNNKANKENENNEINKEIKKNENKINKENKENIENENSEINKEIKEIKKNIINTHNNKENNETEGSKENINILAKNGEIKYIETKNKGVNKNFVGVDNICKEKSKGKNKKKETFCCL